MKSMGIITVKFVTAANYRKSEKSLFTGEWRFIEVHYKENWGDFLVRVPLIETLCKVPASMNMSRRNVYHRETCQKEFENSIKKSQ